MRTLFELAPAKRNVAKAKAAYREIGPDRSKLRYGWIRAYE
jgi:hypothetical protein